MVWAILIVIMTLILFLATLNGQKQVTWSDKLYRMNAGVSHKAEWMAPEFVIQQVRNDYLMAMRWLRECAFLDWSSQWNAAPAFLAGFQLERHQNILKLPAPRFRDVLRADHEVEVRHFSGDGERCLVIDRQTNRSIATYDYWTFEPCLVQALDDAALVYQMVYDKTARRWKIEQFVQELPRGWHGGQSRRVQLYSTLPPTNGRDH